MKSFLSVLFSLLLLTSCNEKPKETVVPSFFNVKTYFTSQALLLTTNKISLKKFITKDQATEEKFIASPEWDIELKPFAECDINNSSISASYTVDTLADEFASSVTYKAKEPSLKVQKLSLFFAGDSLTLLSIVIKSNSFYYKHSSILNYTPWKGYSITNFQKMTFSQGNKLTFQGVFIH